MFCRELDTDFLLALLRDVLNYRKDLKVILMSATLDAGIFMQHCHPHRHLIGSGVARHR
jgi:HrpA-like RNA helicase